MWRTNLFLLLLFNVVSSNPISKTRIEQPFVDNPAVKLLKEYIQIDTSREENIESAVNFWKRQAADVGLTFAVYRPTSKPVCVITWTGANLTLPSIILNSHMDVVPVNEQEWTYPPFSGHIDENGNMYGRGTQDTKSVGIHYLEAIKNLKQDNVTLQRTIHITLMPDEEVGGFNGIVPFIETKAFTKLNAGFFFDEGLSSTDGTLYATYQDKRPWQLNITVHGEGGHGSTIPDGGAMEKVQQLLDITMRYREQQKQIMISKDAMDFGSYTTLNVNIIKIQTWIARVGNGTELSFIRKYNTSEATRLDESNSYWVAFVEALRDMDINIKPIVCPATTDMLFLRNRGIPAIGFAYRPYTVSRIHAADEYINISTFAQGIKVYANVLKKVGNLPY